MKLCAIDFSTRSADYLLLDVDGQPPEHPHYEATGETALERTRTLTTLIPHRASSIWDEIAQAVIEEPRGLKRVSSPLYRVQGAIIAGIPPRVPVWVLTATEWRHELGLFAGADRHRQKQQARDYSIQHGGNPDWPEDAFDAHCMVLAAQRMLDRGKKAA